MVGRVCGPPASPRARVSGAAGGTGIAGVTFERLSCGPVPTRLEPWFLLPECSAGSSLRLFWLLQLRLRCRGC